MDLTLGGPGWEKARMPPELKCYGKDRFAAVHLPTPSLPEAEMGRKDSKAHLLLVLEMAEP